MTTNTELLTKNIEQRILYKIHNLDSCVRFDGVDSEYLFLNSLTDEVAEVSFKYDNISIHRYRFFEHASKILKTQTENRLLCDDWTEDEFIILRHILEQRGITNYKINKLPPVKDLEEWQYHEIIFEDVSDVAMFEFYFQTLFNHDLTKEEIELLKKNGMLK